MRKWVFVAAALGILFISSLAIAAGMPGRAGGMATGRVAAPPPNGEERSGVLYLFEKTPLPADPQSGPWPIVQGGAWGILRHNLWGEDFRFDFHGRNLGPHTEYTLIYYPDPWPGAGLICFAAGRSTAAGNLSMADFDFEIGTSLPAQGDANFSANYPSGAVGAKIWLVLSSDVDCNARQMIDWKPAKYLFEFNLINFEHRAK